FRFAGIAVAHGCVSARSFSRSSIRSNGFIPHPQTRENVRWHVQRVRYPGRDGSVPLCRSESALGERRIIVTMDQVMNDPGMVWVFFPQLFQDRTCLKLFRQACVVRRGVTGSQDCERVEGLEFKIVRILVAELMHCFFVSNDTVAWSDWSVTRLSDGACARTVRRIVINIERRDEAFLAVRSGVHRHCFFNSSFASAHLIGSRWCPNRMPPCHGDSPRSHRALGVAFSYRSENAPRLFVEK